MRKLSQLIRLHKSKLEGRRRKVAELEELFDGLMGEVRGLEESALREGRMVSDAPDSGFTLGGFLQNTRERKARILESAAEVEKEIEIVQEDVKAAFRELKKFQMADERQNKKAALLARRREQAAQDELGLNMFRRKPKPVAG